MTRKDCVGMKGPKLTLRRVRVVAATTAMLMALSVAWLARADNLYPITSFCDGSGTQAIGEGSPSEVGVNADVFGPAFASKCPGIVAPTVEGTLDVNAVSKLQDRSRDFGVSDIALSPVQKVQLEEDQPQFRNRTSVIQQIPLYVDAQAIGFNLACLPPSTTLNLRSPVLSLIFAGEIRSWGDPKITLDNPALRGCLQTISLIKRAGFAGSTSILKDYLSKRNSFWDYYKQPEHNQEWPPDASFIGAASDDSGMASWIINTPGAIGYLQLNAAVRNRVRMAAVDGPAGTFQTPSQSGCSAAAATVVVPPSFGRVWLNDYQYLDTPPPTQGDWSTVSITDAPVGYSICNFGYWYVFGRWLNAYQGLNPPSTIRTIADYLTVALDPRYGQAGLQSHNYTPLPPAVLKAAQDGVAALRYY